MKDLNFQMLVFLLSVTSHNGNCNSNVVINQSNRTPYISGGNNWDDYDLAKYVVSIQLNIGINKKYYFGWYHFCGGSIIGKTKILTAAHCLLKSTGRQLKPKEIVVVVGLQNRFIRANTTRVKKVAKIGIHEDYGKDKTLGADVGYVILKEEILFDNPGVGIIELPYRSPQENQLCTVVGWGKLFDRGPNSDDLNFADVYIFSQEKCKWVYTSKYSSGMACAADPDEWSKDACYGDSGGPLICERQIVGIVSWGIGCGIRNFPGVYTDVYYYKDWIEANGGRLCASGVVIMVYLIKFLAWLVM